MKKIWRSSILSTKEFIISTLCPRVIRNNEQKKAQAQPQVCPRDSEYWLVVQRRQMESSVKTDCSETIYAFVGEVKWKLESHI